MAGADFNITEKSRHSKDNKSLTNAQIGIILNNIACTAKAIDRLAIQLAFQEDERDAEAVRFSVESLSQRIGFLADKIAYSLPDALHFYGGDDEWFMPPSYHWKREEECCVAAK